jgi:hypothetical protein
MRATAFVCFGLALAACGAAPAPAGGTVQFRFAAGDMVKNSSSLVDPLKGTFYGDIFLQEDVSLTGPRSDAMQFQSLEIASIDLTAKGVGEPSEVSFTTMNLAKGKYVVLGFLDVDANGATTGDRGPDAGDPVTLALTNKFEITDGNEAKRLILLELIYN